ncbi:MAG: zinc-ribbon domain-containing protein [Leptolyngbyaceae cyanobacterium bins.302]|nr:zinc-ribbon domain-containing protein [Leptolyngbyaceae cyanobacterium bins.302]
MPSSTSLASQTEIAISDRLIDHPDLLNEWHPNHNGMIRKDRLTSASYRRVWWQCSQNPKHEWRDSICFRFRYPGCPLCDPSHPRRPAVLPHGQLTLEPEPDTPSSTVRSSDKLPDEVVSAPQPSTDEVPEPLPPVANTQSPTKAHPAPLLSSSISTCARAIAPELHPTKNGNHSADTIPWNSAVPVWWQCSVDPTHEWEESPYERTREQPFRPCPFCNHQSTTATEAEQRTPELPPSRPSRPRVDSIQTTILPKIKKPGKVLDLSRSQRDQLRCAPLPSASTTTKPSSDRPVKSSVQILTLTLVEARWTLNGPGVVTAILQLMDQRPITVSRFFDQIGTDSYWLALILGLRKALNIGFTGRVVASIHDSKIVQQIEKALSSPDPSSSVQKMQQLKQQFTAVELQSPSEEQNTSTSKLAHTLLQQHLRRSGLLPATIDNLSLQTPGINLRSNIQEILDKPYVEIADLIHLRLPKAKDEFSEFNLSELSRLCPDSVATMIQEFLRSYVQNNTSLLNAVEWTETQLIEVALRWYLRGLPAELAIRKALLSMQSGQTSQRKQPTRRR